MIIDELTSRIMPIKFSDVGYKPDYDIYTDIIENQLRERGYNRELSTRYNNENIADKTVNWLHVRQYNIERLLYSLTLDYNPIHNYDGTEKTTHIIDSHADTTIIGATSGTINNKTNAYNTNSLVDDTSSNTTTEESTNTINYGGFKDVTTIEKGGNLGVTTSEQMLTGFYNMHLNYNVINIICDMWINDFTVEWKEVE